MCIYDILEDRIFLREKNDENLPGMVISYSQFNGMKIFSKVQSKDLIVFKILFYQDLICISEILRNAKGLILLNEA